MFIDWDRFEDCLRIARVLLGEGEIEDGDLQDAQARKERLYPSLDAIRILEFAKLFHEADHVQEKELVSATARYFHFLIYVDGPNIQTVAWLDIVRESNHRMENCLRNDDEMIEAEGFDPDRHVRYWLAFPEGQSVFPIFAKWRCSGALNLDLPDTVREQFNGQMIGEALHVQYAEKGFLVASIEVYTDQEELRPYGTRIVETDEIYEVWLVESKYFDFES